MSIVVFERNKSMIAPPVINGVTKMRTGAKMSWFLQLGSLLFAF